MALGRRVLIGLGGRSVISGGVSDRRGRGGRVGISPSYCSAGGNRSFFVEFVSFFGG